MRLILACLLLFASPALAVHFSLQLARNSFTAGERIDLKVKVLEENGTLVSNYMGWVNLRSTDPTLRIRGKNNDGSDIDLTGNGNILISDGTNKSAYIYSFQPGEAEISAEEYMTNYSVPVETKSLDYIINELKRGVLFNEIMFKTVSTNYHYIEIYNAAESPVDLFNISVFRYKSGSSGNTTNKQLLAQITNHILLGTNGYFVIAKNKDSLLDIFTNSAMLAGNYYSRKPDGNSYGLIMSRNGTNQDAFEFSSGDTTDNVSLERQSFDLTASWAPSRARSPVLSSFFGTPGRTNSMFSPVAPKDVKVDLVSDKKILPAGETCSIKFTSDTPGRTAVFLHDSSGRRIRNLFAESDIGRGVEYLAPFDGTDENSKPLPVGVYVVSLRFINDELGLTLTKNIIVIIGWKQ